MALLSVVEIALFIGNAKRSSMDKALSVEMVDAVVSHYQNGMISSTDRTSLLEAIAQTCDNQKYKDEIRSFIKRTTKIKLPELKLKSLKSLNTLNTLNTLNVGEPVILSQQSPTSNTSSTPNTPRSSRSSGSPGTPRESGDSPSIRVRSKSNASTPRNKTPRNKTPRSAKIITPKFHKNIDLKGSNESRESPDSPVRYHMENSSKAWRRETGISNSELIDEISQELTTNIRSLIVSIAHDMTHDITSKQYKK
jgi:hypothetical protein